MKNKIISGVKYYRWKTDFPFISSFDLKLSVLEENAVANYMKKHNMPVIAYKGGFFLSEKTDTQSFKREIAKDTLNLYMMSIFLPDDCFISPKLGFEYKRTTVFSGWGFRLKQNDSYFDEILSNNKDYFITHKSLVHDSEVHIKKNIQELVNSSNWSLSDNPKELFGERNLKLLEECFREEDDFNDFLFKFVGDQKNSLSACVRMLILSAKIKSYLVIDYNKNHDEVKKQILDSLNTINSNFVRNITNNMNFKKTHQKWIFLRLLQLCYSFQIFYAMN